MVAIKDADGRWRDPTDHAFRRLLVDTLSISFDGRPDSWQSIGERSGSAERFLYAELEGRAVGCAWGHRQPDEIVLPEQPPNPYNTGIHELEALSAGTWFIKHFAVHPAKRRQGIGGRLLSAAEEVARSCGARGVSLIVPLPDAPDPGPQPPVIGYEKHRPLRTNTISFLEKRGYTGRGRRNHFYSLGIPVTNQLMMKDYADG